MCNIDVEEIVLLSTALAISLSKGKTAEELEFLSYLFTQVSSSLLTILAGRALSAKKDAEDIDIVDKRL
jgi:hypothetical protein